ncbi:hypothetical protein ACHQM5_018256 [Ranunculus cassubicifolius]
MRLFSSNYIRCYLSHYCNSILQSQSLAGVLPPELVKLPYLQTIILNRNYLSGPIPREWGAMNLTIMLTTSDTANNTLTGSRIQITPSLKSAFNVISYYIPLVPLLCRVIKHSFTPFSPYVPDDVVLLTSNNFGGALPESLAKLTNLKDLWISDNKFTGSIPNFIQNLTNLERIDLSFNKLTGSLPNGFSSSSATESLSRSTSFPQKEKYVPNISRSGLGNSELSNMDSQSHSNWPLDEFDLNKVPQTQYLEKINDQVCFIAPSFSYTISPTNSYSFHINCGGGQIQANGNLTYEEDVRLDTASTPLLHGSNLVLSDTGKFMDTTNDNHTATNISKLTTKNEELYMTARLSPISLTYYGYCLINGNYTVNLHFAEIMFTAGSNYSSLGRRIFDIYIQGELVKKDFNIVDEAGGVGKAIIKTFPAIVDSSTLEIRFYWAGKGTQGIPARGIYGPLVSAISVSSDFEPLVDLNLEDGKKMSTVIEVVIVLSVLTIIVIILSFLWWKGCLKRKKEIDQDLRGLDQLTTSFTLQQIVAATDNFGYQNKIGEGGFGPVYKGRLSDGTIIAVKQLSSKSNQGNREFINEIGLISALQHPNLVKLCGCCIDGNQLFLIYEYMENNSLARALFGREDFQLHLVWKIRRKILVGVARAIAYLHEESKLKIVHRDIKSTNVLLDKDLNAKVSDFGLARLNEDENTHISTRIAGTVGYMAPEYAMKGYLTDKVDVYSFGVVVLEVISGKNNTSYIFKDECDCLLEWAQVLHEKGYDLELVDQRLESNYNKAEVLAMVNIALLCTSTSPTLRPTMSSVVSMLEGRTIIPNFVSDPNNTFDDTKFKAIMSMRDMHTQSMSSIAPSNNSSASFF